MRWALTAAVLLLSACRTAAPPAVEPPIPDGAEAVSWLGTPLVAPELAPDVKAQREEQLAAARREYERNPASADAIIWLGRRTAYLGRYREAIRIFSEGIAKHPRDARMYRHRGHRYITLRQLDAAISDLQRADELTRGKADEIEPDGLPNARNTPIGSLQSNICYHLGLAWYLKGDFEKALPVYERCNRLSTNPDRLVSTTHWLYMTLRRLGRTADAEKVLAPISSSLEVIENSSYHKLTLMYSGEIAPEELAGENPSTTEGATILYGVGNWYLYHGQPDKGMEIFRRIVDGGAWAAFGFLGAEAELARFSSTKRNS
ncbi:MAG TPA: tetratricopeptide repeat protein [Thermoanaerobaculia bacterium]|nr:tetratricopeptide repeat protein [Thermoanaerobaculia bacterium]